VTAADCFDVSGVISLSGYGGRALARLQLFAAPRSRFSLFPALRFSLPPFPFFFPFFFRRVPPLFCVRRSPPSGRMTMRARRAGGQPRSGESETSVQGNSETRARGFSSAGERQSTLARSVARNLSLVARTRTRTSRRGVCFTWLSREPAAFSSPFPRRRRQDRKDNRRPLLSLSLF